jgi:hypothetical protein
MNNDGLNDIIIQTGNLQLAVIRQDTNHPGTLLPPDYYSVETSYYPEFYSFAVGDINGDGRNDIVVQDPGDNPYINLFIQDATGRLNRELLKGLNFPAYGVHIADINGDGLNDIVGDVVYASNRPSGNVMVLPQAEDHSFSQIVCYEFLTSSGGGSEYFNKLAVGDLTGDGYASVAVTWDQDGLFIFPNIPAQQGQPGAPTCVIATPGNAQAKITFRPPTINGSAISYYTVTSDPGGIESQSPKSPITIPGLTNGTPYIFTVTATNEIGPGPAARSSLVMPVGPPGPPSIGTAIAGNGQATVSFSPPQSDGGSSITGYIVSSNPKGGEDTNAGSTSLTHIMTNLKNGTKYTFSARAMNALGTGPASQTSEAVTPAKIPGQPTNVKATAGKSKGTVVVTFNAPGSNGGSTITSYTVTSTSDGSITKTGKSSPITVTGLMSGASYTFEVKATNAMGDGAYSVNSNPVTPK